VLKSIASYIASVAVAIIIFKVDDDGHVSIATMEYTKNGHSTIRIPVGTGEDGEDLLAALHRETVEEVAKDPENFEFRSLNGERPVWGMFAPDQDDPNGLHLKAVYAIEVTCGELRDYAKMDGDELLGPLSMTEVSDLIKEMGRPGRSVFFHRQALAKILSVLAREKPIWDHYSGLISKLQVPEDLTEKEICLVDAFMLSRESVK